MKTKLLCITMLIFTVLIFGGNHYAARNEPQSEGKCNCDCILILGAQPQMNKTGESCSVIFRNEGGKLVSQSLEQVPPRPDHAVHTVLKFSCGVAVFCDKSKHASLFCGRQILGTNMRAAEALIGGAGGASMGGFFKCSLACVGKGVTAISCDTWHRPPPWASTPSSMLLAPTKISTSLLSGFLPPKYNHVPDDDEGMKEVITSSTRWRLLDGEAGIEQGMLMVAKGEAEARSFCTGDTIRLVGPNVLSLPTCQPDVSGRWQGAYARRLSGGRLTPVVVSLNLRKESGSLRGELITSDGTFNIVQGSQSGSDIRLQAERTVAGTQGKINLNGKLMKGEIVFDGR